MDYTKKSHRLIPFIFPALFIYLVFCLYPILASCFYSLLDWNGASLVKKFIWFDNYIKLLKDPVFYIAMKNSLIFALFGIFIRLPLALLFAILVNHKSVRLKKMFRFTYFLPTIISTSAIALMWNLMYDPSFGLINSFLNNIGLSNLAKSWLTDPSTAIFCCYIPGIFGAVGFNFVLYSAGIGNISNELYEAAEIDGATYTKTSLFITLPLLKDVLVMSFILDLTASLKNFDIVWILTQGGPAHATEQLSTYMYSLAFSNGKMGYGSTIAVIIFILSLLYTFLIRYLTKKDLT